MAKKAKKKVLIIYENVPESTDVFVVEVSDDEWEWMKLTMGTFFNATGLSKKQEKAHRQLSEWLERNKDKKVDTSKPFTVDADTTVLFTGFFL